eukprot:1151235-Pelagomonas_calceolata.AAC.2
MTLLTHPSLPSAEGVPCGGSSAALYISALSSVPCVCALCHDWALLCILSMKNKKLRWQREFSLHQFRKETHRLKEPSPSPVPMNILFSFAFEPAI